MELTGEKKDWGRGMAEAFSMVKDQAPLVHVISSISSGAWAMSGLAPMAAMASAQKEAVT